MADGSYAILKAIVIGDSGSGKTWLITSFLGGDLNAKQNTIGIEFSSRSYIVDEKPIKVQFWDTAGKVLFNNRSNRKSYSVFRVVFSNT